MKPFARINLSSVLFSVALSKVEALRRGILVSSLALAAAVVAGCASARFENDPNVVFAVECGWDGDFTFRQLRSVGVDERAIDSGVKAPSGKYSVVVECPSPDVSGALSVDIMALADDGAYNVSVPLAFTWGKRIEGQISNIQYPLSNIQ